MASGLLSLKWNNHRSTFFHILSTVRNKGNYCDVSLACEGKLYPVHKLVLSTCSEYFEQMFEHVDCKHPIIVLKDIHADDLEALLNYMYIGEVNVLQDKLAGLIKAAECLQIKGLAVPDEAPEKAEGSSREKRTINRIAESPQPKRRRPMRDSVDENADDESRTSVGANRLSSRQSSSSDSVNSPYKQTNVNSSHSESRSSKTKDDERGSSGENGDTNKSSKSKDVPELILDDNVNVKDEPEDPIDNKEELHTTLGFDNLNDGSDHASTDATYIDDHLLAGGFKGSEEEGVAGSSGFQGGSFSMWEGDGSMQEFPTDNFSGDSSQRHQMNVKKKRSKSNAKDPANMICPFCVKVFKQSSHLKRHIRSHTGERPYHCPHCSHKAGRKDNLDHHMFSKHGINVPRRQWIPRAISQLNTNIKQNMDAQSNFAANFAQTEMADSPDQPTNSSAQWLSS